MSRVVKVKSSKFLLSFVYNNYYVELGAARFEY